jgi:hypothetical protein
MFLWSDDTKDSGGASVAAQQGTMDGIIASYPEPHMVLQHSVKETSKSKTRPLGRGEPRRGEA